ncbi:permease-like cell division protein FtsX [Galbitalea sp. SE-J8]|uniref:permease-like cell division protein FtsX n=1 Tax=Galbitalea sp. SE-J8 TaxID=3054952 RepID=UPI00259CBFD2|nr:permease-like cell division protein FtsX [Galbitalea sp. SE-J8]MDM4764121.1 permease-like cell division protein FtsX [Galbitalea sp. SE-J8]
MRLRLVLREAASGLRRNVSMVISVVLVTFISLTFVGAAILLQFQIGQMKGYWYDRAQVAVYLCTVNDSGDPCAGTETTDDQKAAIQAQLDSDALKPYVKNVQFEDHKQAYDNFKQQFSDSSISDYLTPDLLPESFRVQLVDPSQAAVIVEAINGLPGVQSVDDQRQYLDQIFAILSAASYTAVGLATLMLVAAVLLIATTIRLSAFSRRRELGIMRLVGASNRFIQTPFILEGVFAAVIGSVLASGAIVAIVQFFVRGYLRQALGATSTVALIGVGDAFIVVPILIVVGVVLAAASAGFAISRYLRV